jgi:8-oxo-dGTP pyrophosphatase MutT (NUDIX family)
MNRQKSYNFCNNCTNQGHLFSQCKMPITSVGIVSFIKENMDIKYLMICRKDSLGFIEFLRGKYPLYNKEYIQTLVDEMTISEKERIISSSFDDLWKGLWGDFIGIQYRSEEKHAKEKFIQIKRGIQIYDEGSYDIISLVKESNTTWDTPEWGFPKGRRNYQETDITCAYREFNEETGFIKEDLDMITNIQPFEEIFIGSNYKSYRHKYYIAELITGDTTPNKFQKSEVSDMKWLTLDECLSIIRPYNLEKLQLIKDINNVLDKYRLIS